MKLVSTAVDPNLLQSTSHPLLHLQVFSDCTSLCALTEEDSRLFYERASLVGGDGGGGGGSTKAATESEKEEETLAAGAVRTTTSLWPLFVV